MKRAVILLLVGIVVLLGLFGYIAILHPPFGVPASWTYGVGRFCLFKSVIGPYDLGLLLDEEKVQEFNQRRQEGIFVGKYLNLSGLCLVGKDLRGVDLSKCVLKGCNFSGSDLRGASFKGSYVAETRFCAPFSMKELPSPKLARRTDLEGADFSGAVMEADFYAWVELGYMRVTTCPEGFSYCKRLNVVGLPGNLPPPEDMQLTPDGFQALVSPKPPHTENILDVSVPCSNPFASIPEIDSEAWKALVGDFSRLRTLQARRIETSMPHDRVVNPNSNLVVVVTGSSGCRPQVMSAGPVALTDVARAWSVVTDGVLWLRDEAEAPQRYAGHPVIVGPGVHSLFDKAILSPVFREPGDPKTKQTTEWFKRMLAEEGLEETARRLSSGGRRLELKEVSDWLQFVGRERGERLLQQHPQIKSMRFVSAAGAHLGSGLVDIVQAETNTVLVLEADFTTHGKIFSAGPVIQIYPPPYDLVFPSGALMGLVGTAASRSVPKN